MREESKNYGRVTLAMAYMLYAEIVMYQNDDSRYTPPATNTLSV